MAELADALASGASGVTPMEVQVLSAAYYFYRKPLRMGGDFEALISAEKSVRNRKPHHDNLQTGALVRLRRIHSAPTQIIAPAGKKRMPILSF